MHQGMPRRFWPRAGELLGPGNEDFNNEGLVHIMTSIIVLGTCASSHAGSVTATGFDKSATIDDLKTNVPQGATITDTSCETVSVPSGGDNKFRCTVT